MTTKKTRKLKLISFFLSLSLLLGLISTSTFAQNGGVSHTSLMEAVPIFLETKLASLPEIYDSSELMVFTDDIPGLDQYNRSQIRFSTYNDYFFTEPREIELDGTWDMDPFIYSNDDVLVAWSDSTTSFNGTPTGDDIASAMRISLAAFNPGLDFNSTISNVSSYGSDNISTYNPKVTKFDDKILVSWVVCHNIKNDTKAYGIEGLFYNPETNAFYSENNEEDASGNPVPMVFAKDCNYISNYSIYGYWYRTIGFQAGTIFEEAIDQTHISDVMLDRVVTQSYSFHSDKYKDNIIKMSTNKGNDVTNLTDGASYASIVDSDFSPLVYYNKNKIYAIEDLFEDPIEIADVSKTGDSKYSFILKNNTIYLTAIQYEPLKTQVNEINIDGKTYTKTDDEKWVDKEGNIKEIKQEDICLYYLNPETQHLDLLSQKLYNQDRLYFPSPPSFIINESNQLKCIYTIGEIRDVYDSSDNILAYSKCDEQYLLQADYSKVNEAINKANALNKDNYIDFSTVAHAIDAVIRDKDYTAQDTVNSYADAIEDAIKALVLKPADYSKVDEAINIANALNKDNYKDFSAIAHAIDAVIRDKDITAQETVNSYANAIEDAIKTLVLKPADYSKVDEAINIANALNKENYKDFSAIAHAINAVIRDKDITAQEIINSYEKAIEDAIKALVLKPADYSKVDEAINIANALNKENYKDFSAIAHAINAVIRDKDITAQEIINSYEKAIEDAIKALVLKPADYSKVDEAINKVNALNKENYKDFSAVAHAIDAVIRDKDITAQETVNSYAKAIEDVIKALELKPADYSKVDEAINKANALNKDNYKDFSAVANVIDSVIRDKDITAQETVNSYAKAIEDAIKTLELKPADYSMVDEAINKANALIKENYKDFSAVANAIDAVIRDKDITAQETVNSYAKAIEDAIKALELKPADYSKVDEAINKANALIKENYKDFSAVAHAIDAVIRDKDITAQETVNSYANAIEDAFKALELKPVTPPVVDNPKMVEGANQTIEQGKDTTFKSNADFKDFQKILVDGKEISSNNYILREGSTIVILKADYVKTLNVGKHTISIVSTTGSADAEFVIIKTSTPTNPDTNSPQTGDNSNMILWATLLFVSVGGVFTLTLKRKKSGISE